MSQVFLPVPPRLAGAPGATREMAPRTRRGHSAGRRRGDEHGLWDDPAVLFADQSTTHEAAETILAKRDRMIAIFGHDLRGLLNALTVNAELLVRKEKAADVESARNVRRTIGRMAQLITSLLDSVRLNANRLTVVPRPLDAAELLREAVEIFRPLARVKALSMTLSIPKRPLQASADHGRIFQVISNLLSNAIKFSSVKGKITVQATTSGHEVQVAVRDDGPGIPERDLDRVFEGYCQLQDSDDRGLGLGLYISRAIIQAHGGKIWATSRPGAGSTFYFTVPRSESEPEPAGPLFGAPRGAIA
jgi:chemotaxis family two-component system sensor kinase Cph1